MDITVVDAAGDVSHVTLSGRMNPHGSTQVRERLRAETVERNRPAVIDISGVTFITSVGIGILVDCAESLRRAGHTAIFVRASGQVDDVFRKTGIYQIVETAETLEDALGRLDGAR